MNNRRFSRSVRQSLEKGLRVRHCTKRNLSYENGNSITDEYSIVKHPIAIIPPSPKASKPPSNIGYRETPESSIKLYYAAHSILSLKDKLSLPPKAK